MNKFNLHAFADEAGKPIDVQIQALCENNYQGLEIRKVDKKNVTQLTVEEAKEIHKRLEDAGLYVWSMGSPIGKIDINDDFEKHLDEYKHTLELSKILDAKAFRLFSFYMPEGEDPAQYGNKVLEQMARFCEIGKEYDIKLCHENEKGIYGDIASRCLEIHKACPELYAIFDPANFVQCHQDTIEAWDMLHTYVDYLHIKDANEQGIVVPAGEGLGNVGYVLKKYYEQGGRNLTLEPHLKVFDGLKDLEKNVDESGVGRKLYASSREAFDTAVAALNVLIQEV